MALIKQAELSFIVNNAYELCSHGYVFQGRKVLEHLNTCYPNNQVIECGLAFSHMVVNEFAQADMIYDRLCANESVFDEVLALAAMSKFLQEDMESAQKILAKIKDSNSVAAILGSQLKR